MLAVAIITFGLMLLGSWHFFLQINKNKRTTNMDKSHNLYPHLETNEANNADCEGISPKLIQRNASHKERGHIPLH